MKIRHFREYLCFSSSTVILILGKVRNYPVNFQSMLMIRKEKKKHFLGTSRDSRERKNFFMVIAPKIGPIHR